MRIPEYLSPSALGKWEFDREEFYKHYLCDTRLFNEPQSPAMAVGSAFDAYVKSALHRQLFGESNSMYSLDVLMCAQVDEAIRDWARTAGRHAFNCYQYSGAYDELLNELNLAVGDPQFEFTVQGVIGGVPLRGKPDCRFVHQGGAHVMLDWKVSGYCSNRTTSPKKLYAMVRDGQHMAKPSRNDGKPHADYKPLSFKGLTIGSHYLEEVNPDWADQLAIYGWMVGEEPGAVDMVARIDQLACKPAAPVPCVRVANHRARISSEWQMKLVSRLQDCWQTILSGHIFTDRPRDESDALCEVLDMMVEDGDRTWQSLKGGYRK